MNIETLKGRHSRVK